MFIRTIPTLQSLLVLAIGCASSQAEETWIDLFDGKTLNGWTINPAGRGGTATVVGGEIHLVGERKFFLCSEKTYSDFIFEAEVKLPEGPANSGFMFRCHVEPNRVWGYQAEIDGSKRAWSGGLFDEARRRWLYPQSPEDSTTAIEFRAKSKGSFQRDGWNKCRIQAEGNRLRIWINGVLCTDYLDDVDAEGHIALQHHGEKGQVYRFRNIRIAEIRKAVRLSYDQPAREWRDALPVGNSSMGAMVFGGVGQHRIQFNHAGPAARWGAALAGIDGKSYDRILADHQADHRALFRRVAIDLGGGHSATLPTNERLNRYQAEPDAELVALLYQYGRYLLIASSRPGGESAKLEGIWNDRTGPPWGSKYTININTEMNYWPAEQANLSECHEPLFDMLDGLAVTGAEVARDFYGAKGWVVHHNSDGWRGAAPINKSNHGIWPSGGAWLSTHLWEHYLFTRRFFAIGPIRDEGHLCILSELSDRGSGPWKRLAREWSGFENGRN